MIEDCDWTKPYFGVSHKVRDRMQFTIADYVNFAELTAYSWNTHQVNERLLFFVLPVDGESVKNPWRYWNCGSIEKAISWAKHYVNGCYEMEYHKKNLSAFEYHLDEIESQC